MSIKDMSHFGTLPTEIVYKIFSYIDAVTIVRSLRCVCKRLYDSVNGYDQFDLNFQKISMNDFQFLCNYIKLNKITSLSLYDDEYTPGQMEYFLSLYRLRLFQRLRSLTLIEIDCCYLNIILNDIQTNQLNKLIITSQRDYSTDNSIGNHLRSLLSLPTLTELTFNIPSFDISQIDWPNQCSLRYLHIHCVNLNEYYRIVRYFPCLKELVIEGMFGDVENGILPKGDDLQSFIQLNSLVLKHSQIDFTVFQIILSLTSTIKSLELISSMDLNEFLSNISQWEIFLQTNLSLLKKFQFFFHHFQYDNNNPVDISSILSVFQTNFWIDTKKWFVTCEYIPSTRRILLHTESFFDSQYQCTYHSKQIISSTFNSNSTVQINQMKKISLDLTQIMPLVTSKVVIQLFIDRK